MFLHIEDYNSTGTQILIRMPRYVLNFSIETGWDLKKKIVS